MMELEKVSGEVYEIIFQNEENGYTVLNLDSDSEGLVTVVGTFPYIKEGEIMMLSHVANPVQNSAWKVLSVNGNSIAEMGFDKDEKLESVELMLMGSLSETAETAQIIVGVYENEKLLSLDKKTFKISGEIYNIDFLNSVIKLCFLSLSVIYIFNVELTNGIY